MDGDARSATGQTGSLKAKTGPFKLDFARAGSARLPPLQPASPTAWLKRRPVHQPEDPLAVFAELGDSLHPDEAQNPLAVRYYILAAYLRERADQPGVILRIEDIEHILGGPLPRVAHLVDLFWSNQATYAGAWLSAGFRARRRRLPWGIVAFINETVPAEDGPEHDALRSAAEAAWLAGGAWVQLRLPELLPAESGPWHEREAGSSEGARERERRDPVGGRGERAKKGAGRGLALRLTQEFCEGRMDLARRRARATGPLGTDGFSPHNAATSATSATGRHPRERYAGERYQVASRVGVPADRTGGTPALLSLPLAGWKDLPEVVVASLLRDAGATEVEARLFLTFGAAMNRGQDPDRLWLAALELFRLLPWAYDPFQAAHADPRHLAAGLARTRLTVSPTDDAVAWRAIAGSLADAAGAPAIQAAVFDGNGDSLDLLAELDLIDPGTGARLFPALCAPRTGPRWIRMLAYPGGARITGLEYLPLAVDASVRRATECLGVTATRGRAMADVRPHIQETWLDDVFRHGAAAPPGLEGTSAALEPALTFLGRWGCFACERSGRRMPISDACAECRLGVAGTEAGPTRQ